MSNGGGGFGSDVKSELMLMNWYTTAYTQAFNVRRVGVWGEGASLMYARIISGSCEHISNYKNNNNTKTETVQTQHGTNEIKHTQKTLSIISVWGIFGFLGFCLFAVACNIYIYMLFCVWYRTRVLL